MDVMMRLGDFAFSTDALAYRRLTRARVWRWPAQQRLRGDPVRQYVGRGEARVELDGTVHPGQMGDAAALDRLRAMADAGTPHVLVATAGAGAGDILGWWAVERVEEKHGESFLPGGVPAKIAFRIALVFYGEDPPR